MKTVNVIEVIDPNNWHVTVHAFPDTLEGNTEAEAVFERIVRENVGNPSQETMDMYLEDGICEVGEGEGAILLVHSD